MAKSMPDPASAATKWAQNLGAAGQAYTAGVQSVTQAPGQLAAAASDRYLAGVQTNVQKFKANVGSVSLGDWQAAAVNKGAPRLATGASAAQPKMAAVLQQLFPYIEQVRNSLPPRGDIEANIARSAAFQRGMNKFVRR
jgi:hypothetical protein